MESVQRKERGSLITLYENVITAVLSATRISFSSWVCTIPRATNYGNGVESILCDVSFGLSYLHARKPVVIHRDLSPNNVMLTSQPVAKIGDLGVAKVIQADSRQTRSRLTTAPGMVDFMPLETLEANPVYGTAVDMFSYAGIALHVFAEEWPTPCGQKRRDPVTKKLIALTEVERRQEYLDKIPDGGSVLKESIIRCLDDDPDERPPIVEVSETIEALQV